MEKIFTGGLPNFSAIAWELWKQSQALETDFKEGLLPDHKMTRVLVPDLEWAESLRDDLVSFDEFLQVFILYPLETNFVRSRSPSPLARKERLRTLHALAFPTPQKKLFLIPAECVSQKIPSPLFYKDNSISLKAGQTLNRDTFIQALANVGYLPSELVENSGQFALRGAVIDVFPAVDNYPLRIEVLDDELVSMRFFHPESQRKISDLDSHILGPAREFILPENIKSSALGQELKAFIRTQKRPLEDREALYSRFLQRSFFPEIDYWAPFVLSHLNSEWLAHPLNLIGDFDFLIEAHSLESSLVASHTQSQRHFEVALEDGEWAPPSESFLHPLDETLTLLNKQIAQCPRWLSHKKNSGLDKAPSTTHESSLSGFELLESELSQTRTDRSDRPLLPLFKKIQLLRESHIRICFLARSTSQLDRIKFLFEQNGFTLDECASFESFLNEPTPPQICATLSQINIGFCDPVRKIALLRVESLLGLSSKKSTKKFRPSKGTRSLLTGDMALLDLNIGDRVVHSEHGIGKYLGLRLMDFGGIPSELIEVEYRDNNKLFVPVTRLSLIQKHSIAQENTPLDRLGGQTWLAKKSKVKKELVSIAGELLHLYSLREMAVGPSISPPQKHIDAFAETFPFEETDDQKRAIEDCIQDLRGPRPMDRLICGDVGYGKTEVALRAAHAAAAAGFQVAVLVPTTLLALQHENTFKKRFDSQQILVEGLSRFKSTKERLAIIEKLRTGNVNIVIGTHALLSSSIQFKKLGLLIVDEEQKFGVVHKEKIKKMRNNVHVISMSATPIPRTLNMSMSGLKELSLISTPPLERVSVKTYISRKKSELIKEAVTKEISRGGQVFYVHNRVQTILKELEFLKELLPNINIEHVHGQMHQKTLEKTVFDFYQGRVQLLLTTSIVESGLDIPSANTLIVDRADHFGLSQLYQLRGRVGRSSERGFAYFMIPEKGKITTEAEQRLSVLETYQSLGSGFHVASHDLEIRGAGDVLGRSQSGNISALGFDAYSQLLQECVAEIKGDPLERKVDPDIQIPIDSTIPEYFIPDIGLRLMTYRRLAAAADEEEVDQIGEELVDRFASLPESVSNLLILMRIKCQLRRLGVRAAVASRAGVSLSFDESTPVNPEKMVESIRRYPLHYQLSPDGKLVIKKPANATDARDVVRSVESALTQLESWCT